MLGKKAGKETRAKLESETNEKNILQESYQKLFESKNSEESDLYSKVLIPRHISFNFNSLKNFLARKREGLENSGKK
jgi:hypothetical protein